MKRYLPLVITLLIGILILGGLVFFLLDRKPSSPEQTTSPSVVSAVIEENPYVILTPDSAGHELELEIKNIKQASVVEFELSYLAAEFPRGAIGEIKVGGRESVAKKILLGSESCSGTGPERICRRKYDEGVTEGVLLLRFRKENKSQKEEVGFHLQKGSEAKEGLSSLDGNFSFQGKLGSSTFYVIHPTIGVPKLPEGKIIAGPYGIFTSGSLNIPGTVKLRLKTTSPQVKILGWDAAKGTWKEYNRGLETDGEIVSVEVDRLTTLIAVSP